MQSAGCNSASDARDNNNNNSNNIQRYDDDDSSNASTPEVVEVGDETPPQL